MQDETKNKKTKWIIILLVICGIIAIGAMSDNDTDYNDDQAKYENEIVSQNSLWGTDNEKDVVENKIDSNTVIHEKKSYTVYITKTGEKYHRENCRYLRQSSIPISLNNAISQGYDPCSVCKP